MASEHCTQQGCMEKFKTSNYTEIETYPKLEWDIIMKGAPCPEHDMRFNRRIPVISDLEKLPLAKKASLHREEVIAIVMYTGPMVCEQFEHGLVQICCAIKSTVTFLIVCSMSSTTPFFENFLWSCTRSSRSTIICFQRLFLFWPLLFKRFLAS